jgi:hypothetical protein
VGEGFVRLPVEVDRPKVNKVEAAADGSFSNDFKFFGGDFGEGGQELALITVCGLSNGEGG